MKNKKKKNNALIKNIVFILLLVGICSLEIVYAQTTATLKFCDYSGVRKTLKIMGIILTLVKISIPIIWIITGMMTFFKAITSGKDEDLKTAASTFGKKLIAGFIVFMLPTMLDYVFDNLVGYSDKGFTQCTNCLLDTGHCKVDIDDPKTTK